MKQQAKDTTRIVIFGNSGSGKSTLAKQYARLPNVAHLDLDTVAWNENEPGIRKDIKASQSLIDAFISKHKCWVIEGCYASLISMALREATEIVFLNPGTTTCQANCRQRPWEPHKYKSKKEQDKNLDMLLRWVAEYDTRTDEFSRAAHEQIYQSFNGKKQEITSNTQAQGKANKMATGL